MTGARWSAWRRAASDFATVLIVSSALVTAALALRRQSRQSTGRVTASGPVPDWAEYRRVATWATDSAAGSDHEAIVFVEPGCAVCRSLLRILDSMAAAHRVTVAVGYLHYPRPAAFPGAVQIAAQSECARRQGLIRPFLELTFSARDSAQLAEAVKRADLDLGQLRQCATDPMTLSLVDRHILIGRQLGIRSGGALLLDGMLIRAPVASLSIDSVLAKGRLAVP